MTQTGEGTKAYSSPIEHGMKNAHSCKFSEAPQRGKKALKDVTGQYEFLNMRAFLYCSIRDWLNPINKMRAALPPDQKLTEELMKTKWEFMSNGKIKIEPKDEVKKRIKRSPDKADSLANTFWPVDEYDYHRDKKAVNVLKGFF